MGTGTQKIFIGFGQMKGESESKGTNGTALKKVKSTYLEGIEVSLSLSPLDSSKRILSLLGVYSRAIFRVGLH